ncbi:GIY-YIG nuclease family protein [Myroides phaeus]|uniref:GIY-YIG catalytic domain-containing protein n=1 Tax=Myroides phaeus TaxID=702745 RepID=A0A1G8FJK2_9FLAO|nr:GIY-YIG nuclease family protein [Myroides phaeus]SDH82343.1 GIY-YIG catalytic domain-containing protein [Myroides phaeus]
MEDKFQLVKRDFNDTVITEIELISPKFLSWPLVYLLSDNKSKSAYIGETTEVQKRMRAHLKHSEKKWNQFILSQVIILISRLH